MMPAQTMPAIIFLSPIGGVSDDAWTAFVRAMMIASFDSVSQSNALGAFEMSPRRLGELGILHSLRCRQSAKSKRRVWVGTFVPPLTDSAFLTNPLVQYRAFCASMTDYASKIARGTIKKPAEISLSGALALCHRAGPKGMTGPRFPETQGAFDRTEGLF